MWKRLATVTCALVVAASGWDRRFEIDHPAAALGSLAHRSEPARVEEVAVPGDEPAVVVRGARAHAMKIVFLHGMCGRAEDYARSFRFAAAAHGDLIALQGDEPCAGGWGSRWSSDPSAISTRIDEAFRAADLGEAHDIVLVGYSQGAERAERLAARYPGKYTRVVLISSPIVPSPARLAHVRRAVLMVGTREYQGNMRAGLKNCLRARIPSILLELPDAAHGQMGPEAERVMGQALDFVGSSAPLAKRPSFVYLERPPEVLHHVPGPLEEAAQVEPHQEQSLPGEAEGEGSLPPRPRLSGEQAVTLPVVRNTTSDERDEPPGRQGCQENHLNS